MFKSWCKPCQLNNKNKIIDDFIQKQQQKINYNSGNPATIFEWIPYDKFNNLKEVGKGGFATVYSAIWEDGPLYYNFNEKKQMRKLNKKVALKCLHNSQNFIDKFLDEVWF